MHLMGALSALLSSRKFSGFRSLQPQGWVRRAAWTTADLAAPWRWRCHAHAAFPRLGDACWTKCCKGAQQPGQSPPVHDSHAVAVRHHANNVADLCRRVALAVAALGHNPGLCTGGKASGNRPEGCGRWPGSAGCLAKGLLVLSACMPPLAEPRGFGAVHATTGLL